MDILNEELLKKRQSLSEETGGRYLFKRSEIEQERIQKRRAEEKRDADAKRRCHNQNQANLFDPDSSLNHNLKLDSFLKVPITDDSLNLPLFGESDDDRLDRLKNVLFGSDLTKVQRNDFVSDIVELKRRVKYGAGGEDGDGHKNMKKNFCELCDEDKILFFFMMLLTEWNKELDEMTEMEKMTAKGKLTLDRFEQCSRYLNPLFNLCRKQVLNHDIGQDLLVLVNCCMKRDYVAAFNHYCQIAIGKSAWFIGVTMVGIQECSDRQLNDETTRKFLTSVKRLMVFCQRRHPVEFDSLV